MLIMLSVVRGFGFGGRIEPLPEIIFTYLLTFVCAATWMGFVWTIKRFASGPHAKYAFVKRQYV